MRHGIKRALLRAEDEGTRAMMDFYREHDLEPEVEGITDRIVNIARDRARVAWSDDDPQQARAFIRSRVMWSHHLVEEPHDINRELLKAEDEGTRAMMTFYHTYHMVPSVEAIVCRIVNLARERMGGGVGRMWISKGKAESPEGQWTAGEYRKACEFMRPRVTRYLKPDEASINTKRLQHEDSEILS